MIGLCARIAQWNAVRDHVDDRAFDVQLVADQVLPLRGKDDQSIRERQELLNLVFRSRIAFKDCPLHCARMGMKNHFLTHVLSTSDE